VSFAGYFFAAQVSVAQLKVAGDSIESAESLRNRSGREVRQSVRRLFQPMERSTRLNQSKSLFDLLALCAAVIILIAALIVRSRLPIIPLADGDTWGYLRPALSWLSGLGFQQTYGRDWLYPALLAAILKIGGDFSAITYVQRFLGLAGILFFWLAWRSWFRLVPVRKPVWLCLVLSISLLALYALSSQQALLESTIRPEGMFAFFEMAYVYCLISFFLARWRFRRTGSAIGFGTALLGLSYAVLLLKPSWGFSLGFTFLCLLAGAFGRTTRSMRFGPLLGGAAAFVLLFSLPKWLGFQKDSQLFLPFTLVSIHAEQILQTRPDVVSPGTHNSGLPDQTFYEELAKAYWPAKENPDHYGALGFDPDYIQYRSGFFSTVMQKEAWSEREMAAACYSAYFRAWLHAPSSMLKKVGKQLRLFFFPRAGDFYRTTQSVDLNNELTTSRPFLPDSELSPDVQKAYQLYRQKLERPEGNSSNPLSFKVLARFAHYIAWSTVWLQVVFVAVLVTVCLSRKGRNFRLAGLVILAVLAATYGNALTIAVVHSLDVVRYRVSYAPGFLLGLALITNYLLSLAFGAPILGQQPGESTAIEANSAPASRGQR
jgi:hypothetical protein